MPDGLLHECPGGCGTRIVRHMLSCRDCWFLLPGALRAASNAAFPRRLKDPAAHREALAACLSWYRDNPPAREVPDGVA